MAIPFVRTERALAQEQGRSSWLALLIATIFFLLWSGWFVYAQVAVWEVAPVARLEVGGAPHPVQIRRSGRVSMVRVALGDRVRKGDALLELDVSEVRLRQAEALARLNAARRDLRFIDAELTALSKEQVAEDRVNESRIAEAEAQARAALAEADVASGDSRVLDALETGGLAPKVDARRASGVARARRAAAQAQLWVSERAARERTQRLHASRTQSAELERERGQRESEAAVLEKELERLNWEMSENTLRAALDGSVGEIASLRVGAVVAAGDRFATLVPSGELKVVAAYTPQAVGRVRVGQPARVRLSGFSWMQYGALPARVTRVGTEPVKGLVQVELMLDQEHHRHIPLQHGLSGNVDIEVERASPGTLVLRAIGRSLSPEPTAESAPASGTR